MVNRVYDFLSDPEWLKEQRQSKSRAQVAKELSKKTGFKKINLASCIRFRELRWYSDETRKTFKFERVPHTNKKKSK